MFRALKNLVLIIVICFTATGIPVYANFVFNYIISDDYVEYNVNLIKHSSERHEVEITFLSSHNSLPLQFDDTNPLRFKLYVGSEELGDVNLNVIQNTLDPLVFSFNLIQRDLDLPNGVYTLEVQPNINNLTSSVPPIKIDFNFDSDVFYISSNSNIESNRTALTLYFPDVEFNRLIPITRFIPYTSIPLRTTLRELYAGPNPKLGLPTGSPIPTVSNLNLANNVARVYLPRDMGKFSEYPTNARIAIDSLVSSLTAINEVNSVQFYINWQIQSDNFHGISIDTPISKDTSPRFYTGYRTDTGRLLLYPIEMDKNLEVLDLFKKLRFSGNTNLYNYRIFPTVPEGVDLLDFSLANGKLELKFNEYFLEFIENDPGKGQLMIDSLVFTYTSFLEVNYVLFYTDVDESMYDIDFLNQPFKRPAFINIEL